MRRCSNDDRCGEYQFSHVSQNRGGGNPSDMRKLSGRNFRLNFRGLAQDVAAAPNGLDIVLALRRIGKLLAELADEDVDDLELGLVHADIEMAEEHFLGQRSAFAQGKQFQHLVLLAGEVYAL